MKGNKMTIEERAHYAEKKWLMSDDVTKWGYEQGYIKGAIDQQKIDIEKAVQYIMVTPAYAVQPEIYAEGLKQAMEK